jgi:prepilin-type N-terminal cleavage/methylation domain-containing protein
VSQTTINNKSGFTLLETLVAVAILMISISSAFSLAPEGLSGSRFAKNQTTATYLAQEALEIVHNSRDNKMLFSPNSADPLNWLANVKQCRDELCTVNPINLELDECNGNCPPVKMIHDDVDDSITYGNGRYFDAAQNTIFTRTVSIQQVPNSTIGRDDTEAKVTVVVSWKEGVITKRTEVSENIFDWMTFNK